MTTRRHDDKGEKNQKSLFDVVGRALYNIVKDSNADLTVEN